MPPLQRLSAMRPRAFRKSEEPRTPEPTSLAEGEQPPSPPRHRFRLRRRNAPELNTAPTHQFLASVAAADAPIPSIEEPIVVDQDMMMDTAAAHEAASSDGFDTLGAPHDGLAPRGFSPPKTPAPGGPDTVDLGPTRSPFPDWRLDSTLNDSDLESSRPSTAHSAHTSSSSFSQLSFTTDRLSHPADLTRDQKDFAGSLLAPEDADRTIRAPMGRASAARKARWTQPMSRHLWSTYTRYLEDPKVTPIRISACGVPPCGVVDRVAREARRSWRGPGLQPRPHDRSGSSTPTAAESSSTFVRWPHTNAATRAHLIEMCKANAGGKARNERYFRSPTPFGKTVSRSRARRMTPARSPSVFSGSDMAMSLALSTSDSMQPGGPLAQLTGSGAAQGGSDPHTPAPPSERLSSPELPSAPALPESRPRLGSPFVAHSYGPSSSGALLSALGAGSDMPRQSHTLGARRSLRSPARLHRSRSSTWKRRSRQHTAEHRRPKRPSLPSDMWSEPAASPIAPPSDLPSSSTFGEELGAAARDGVRDYSPPPALDPIPFNASMDSTLADAFAPAPSSDAPARLGSPFSGLPSSFSFPLRRGLAPCADSGSARPFTSVRRQPSGGGDEGAAAGPSRDRDSRMAYLNERLKLIHQRGEERRRLESPF